MGQNCIEDTGLASATRSIFWRKGKRIGKNVKFIVNEDFYGDRYTFEKRSLSGRNGYEIY